MISPRTAELLHARVGDRIIFYREGSGLDPTTIYISLVGLIEPLDADDEFWFLNSKVFDVPSDSNVIVPLFVTQDTVFGLVGPLAPKTRISCHWYYYIDTARIDSTSARHVAQLVDLVESGITTQVTNGTVFSSLDTTILEYLKKQLYTQVPLYLLVFQIAAIIFYYIATVASMVIEQQTGEIALLRSRGASTFQIFGIFLIEGVIISAFGGIVGPLLGAFIFGLLGKTGPFLPLTGGGLLPIRFSPIVFVLAGVAAGLCLFAFMIPAIQASRRSILHHRQMIARPPRAPIWQRFYLDIILLVAGGGLYYELRQRGSLLTQKIFGDLGVDPLMLITPLLFMMAVAIIFLRLFPLLVNLASKTSRYITSSVITLTLRYMARNPIHYSRLILLLMMAASVGMFSASFLGTLNRSYSERVDYLTGSDVRLEKIIGYGKGKQAIIDQYSSVSGVESLSPVFRSSATVGTFTQTDGDVLAVDPSTLGDLVWYRKDFSDLTVPELMAILEKDKVEKSGILLPDGIEAIGLWVSPVYSTASQYALPSRISDNSKLTLSARIEDGRGVYHDVALGSAQYNDWQYIEAELYDALDELPAFPIRLHCISLSASGLSGLQGVYLDDLQVRGPAPSEPVIIEDFEDISEWTTRSEAQGSAVIQNTNAESLAKQRSIVHSGEYAARYTWNGRTSFQGIFPNFDDRPLSVIASQSFLDTVGVGIGDWLTIRIPGQFVPIEIKASVKYFPSLYPDEKPFIILNFDRLAYAGLSNNNRIYPNEVWLDLVSDSKQRAAAVKILKSGGYQADSIYDRQELLDEQKSDPLVAAGWAGILLISFVGVVLVSGLGFIVYAYLAARSRHLEFAVLRTLGFSWKQIISLVSLEQVCVIGLGMGIGTLLGSRLSRIMMPFLQLTEKGETVIPPFAIVTDWSTISIAYIILTIAFIVTMSLVVLFFSRVALARALRMGEE
jgi:ABC-type lipoprotein release transport system permease subunit